MQLGSFLECVKGGAMVLTGRVRMQGKVLPDNTCLAVSLTFLKQEG